MKSIYDIRTTWYPSSGKIVTSSNGAIAVTDIIELSGRVFDIFEHVESHDYRIEHLEKRLDEAHDQISALSNVIDMLSAEIAGLGER